MQQQPGIGSINVCHAEIDMLKIPVVLKDWTEQTVENDELHRLMADQRIKFFRRRNGWVVVGRDSIRGVGGKYSGVERRNE